VVERYRLLDYEVAKEALEQAEKEWPRAATIDPNYRGNGSRWRIQMSSPCRGRRRSHIAATRTNHGKNVSAPRIVQHDDQYSYFSEKDAHLPTAE
jgi:hypothetical protein